MGADEEVISACATCHTQPSPQPLNIEQRKLYDVVESHYQQELAGESPRQLLLNVDGVAGAGKTFALLILCATLQQLAEASGKSNPAFNFVGKTLHSLLSLPINPNLSDLSTGTLQTLQAHFRYCRYLILDEKSMIDVKTLSMIDNRLRAVCPLRSEEPFGGINILLCGDFFQLPPVGGQPLFPLAPKAVEAIKGHHLYRLFNRTVRLEQVMRQQGEDAASRAFREALSELRVSKLSRESWQLLCTRVASELTAEETSDFNSAVRLYFTKEEVKAENFQRLADTKKAVMRINAEHNSRKARKATEDEAENLAAMLHVTVGARIMLTSNLWTERGLVNGSTGEVVNFDWEADKDPLTTMPYVILVRFDEYQGPPFPGCPPGTLPIFPATRQFLFKGTLCTRTQFPLRLAYAITVHKSQGMTLLKVVLNLALREHSLGLSYVAVSRVKTLDGIMFERPFDFDKFKPATSLVAQHREIDLVARTLQMY